MKKTHINYLMIGFSLKDVFKGGKKGVLARRLQKKKSILQFISDTKKL
jgi:hypothetical protein